MTSHKLSLSTALLVNINVMLGAGIFINTVPLAQEAGFLGFASYALVALLMVPLIAGTALLLHHFPSGGFYTYSARTVHPFMGFVSAWAYFTGKLASAALLVHVCVTMILSIIPSLEIVHPLLWDSAIIGLFAWLTTHHLKTGTALMYSFMVCKVLPILFVLISSIYLWKSWTLPAYLPWSGIPTTIPLVLFAFNGFEACCSLSTHIENAAKNGPRALYLSFFFVVFLTIAYQLFFYLAAAGTLLDTISSYLHIFPALASLITPQEWLQHHLAALLSLALACAALGGSYGILFSNHWNLYALAQHQHVWGAPFLQKLNRYQVPALCITLEALICILYLGVTQAAVPLLQQISALGCVISFTLSMVGLIFLAAQQPPFLRNRYTLIGYSALGSCLLFVGACIRNLALYGPIALLWFGGILGIGILMFYTSPSSVKP